MLRARGDRHGGRPPGGRLGPQGRPAGRAADSDPGPARDHWGQLQAAAADAAGAAVTVTRMWAGCPDQVVRSYHCPRSAQSETESESRYPARHSGGNISMQRSRRAFAYAPKPGRSELELIKKNIGKDGMFEDPDFPVGPKALFADGLTPEGKCFRSCYTVCSPDANVRFIPCSTV